MTDSKSAFLLRTFFNPVFRVQTAVGSISQCFFNYIIFLMLTRSVNHGKIIFLYDKQSPKMSAILTFVKKVLICIL